MKTNAEDGFSLIELIVALSIAAVIGVLLFGGYSFSARAWTKAAASGDDSQEVYAVQTLLRRAFKGITLEFEKTKFAGTPSALAFVSLFALPGEEPQPTELGLSIDPCPEGQCLVLVLSRTEWSAEATRKPIIRTPLLRGIKQVLIAYRGHGDDAAWQPEWPIESGPPSLVRINVTRAGKAPQSWPALYLALPGAG